MNVFIVDVFTGRGARGNTAAVVLLDAFSRDDWMASTAASPEADVQVLCDVVDAEIGNVSRTPVDVLAELDSPGAVERVRPDVKGLLAVDARGVILTAPGGAGADYVARFFAPRIGALEDAQPVRSNQLSARIGLLGSESRS